MPLEMFDREALVQTLDRECLGEMGSSTAIVGGCKVGKSHLLRYVRERGPTAQDTLYCMLDLSLLRASADAKLSDDHFIRFLLTKLAEQIDRWIADQQVDRGLWDEDLQQAQERLAQLRAQVPAPKEVDLSKHKQAVAALATRIKQLERLTDVAKQIWKLLDREDALKVFQMAPVLAQLKMLSKRIILVIDEYDEFLREPGFSGNLFNFLRGQNNEGNMIALVTSNTMLMEPSLHSEDQERKSLFNHFQSKFLIPFSSSESEQFLDWLHPESKLTPDEKSYLQELGGGSPHFLKVASDTFISHQRPQGEKQRKDFERKYLHDGFHEAFDGMLENVSAEEQQALQRVAKGAEIVQGVYPRLERDGYFIDSESGLRLFSPLFADFLKLRKGKFRIGKVPGTLPQRALRKPRGDVEAVVTVRFKMCPTVLYAAAPEYAETAEFSVYNYTDQQIRVQLSCEISGYSHLATSTVLVPPHSKKTETLDVMFMTDKLNNLTSVHGTTVDYKVVRDPGSQEHVVLNRTTPVRLLPIDNFLMARHKPAADKLQDFTWLIAAWVNTEISELRAIYQRAAQREGTPDWESPKHRDTAHAFLSALYDELQQERIGYHDASTVFHQEEYDYVQRVRKPAQCFRTKSANCLDASVLFASLIDLCGLAPGILLLPGHALAGWRNDSGDRPEWQFLETTAPHLKFAEAMQEAEKRLAQFRHLLREPTTTDDEITDPTNFAILVDVHRVRRERKIISI